MRRLLIVIPLYNEEPTLLQVIDRTRHVAPHADLLVVDDGSTDGSADVLRAQPEILVITHARNQGYGQSLIDGFGYAIAHGYDAVVTLDCDGQHEPGYIPRFVAALEDADMVSGSRYLDPWLDGDPAPADRRRLNGMITARLRAVTGYRITDAFCGFKAYRVDTLRRLRLSEASYGLPLQVWVQAAHHQLRVAEQAVPRMYPDPARRFPGALDEPAARSRYYESVLEAEVQRWRASLP